MTLQHFLSLLATILGAFGSIYVLRSILRLSPQIIYDLSATWLNENPYQIESLKNQKAEAIVGTGLIGIALAIQILNLIIIDDTVGPFIKKTNGIFLCFFVIFVVWILLNIFSNQIKNNDGKSIAIIKLRTHISAIKKYRTNENVDAQEIKDICDQFFQITGKQIQGNLQPFEKMEKIIDELDNNKKQEY